MGRALLRPWAVGLWAVGLLAWAYEPWAVGHGLWVIDRPCTPFCWRAFNTRQLCELLLLLR